MVWRSEKLLCTWTYLFPYSTASMNVYLSFSEYFIIFAKQYDMIKKKKQKQVTYNSTRSATIISVFSF